jgi:copper transporter 1
MTYNGSVMLAVAVGAFAGYLAFADDGTSAQKTVACH